MYARKSSKRNSYKRASYGGSRSSVSRYGKAKKSGWTPKFATVETGTTARTRIGNKMKVDYIKGAFTFTSATVTEAISEQGGEQVGTPAGNSARQQYLRTTFRLEDF